MEGGGGAKGPGRNDTRDRLRNIAHVHSCAPCIAVCAVRQKRAKGHKSRHGYLSARRTAGIARMCARFELQGGARSDSIQSLAESNRFERAGVDLLVNLFPAHLPVLRRAG